MPVFLDTNVFLYAAGAPHPQKDPCVRVLRDVAAGTLQGTTSTEVVQEILYVLDRRQRRQDGIVLARRVTALFPDLLPVRQVEMVRACDILGRRGALTVRDAIHVATMLNHGMTTILSADQHFDDLAEEGIQRVDPVSRASS
jgi:predicted nucleic acid-binding protein